MSNRQQSNPAPEPEPEYWLPSAAIRGTFAVRLRPQERNALQAVAAVVLDLAEEAHLTYPDHDLSTAGDLQGAVDDLYHVAGFLGYVVGYCEKGDIQPRERRLVNAAEEFGTRVARLARELEAAVTGATPRPGRRFRACFRPASGHCWPTCW